MPLPQVMAFLYQLMLVAKNINKKYPGEAFGAVVDVSFELLPGEVLSIVGRSGSGKSTLIQMLAGLMKPDSGLIQFDGISLGNPEEQLIAGHKEIKLVHQEFKLKSNMTVAENIRYMLLHYPKEYQEEKLNELLALTGLNAFATKMPQELSGGQKQRLALARALADDPQVLLMDEPFSNLDPITKQDLILEMIDLVKNQEVSIVLVTHDTNDALLASDKVAFISEGEIMQLDAPNILYNQPRNLEIASFFGEVNSFTNDQGVILHLRAEDICVGEEKDSNISLNIKSSRFLGTKFLNLGLTPHGERILFYSNSFLESKRNQTVSFSKSDLLSFKEALT